MPQTESEKGGKGVGPKAGESVLKIPVRELERLQNRLEEAESILDAIRSGQIEALVVNSPLGDQVFTLKGADESYRTFVEVMSEGAVTLGESGVILYGNRRFAEMLDSPLEEVIGSFFQEYLSEEKRAEFDDFLTKAHHETSKVEFTLKSRRGKDLPVSLSIAPFKGEELKSACLVVTDLTVQKQNEERLMTLSRRLLEVQESERRHLARELHDEIGQILTGLKITVETSTNSTGNGAGNLGDAREQIESLVKRVQDMSLDLRPAMLDDLGLLPALLWHFERYTQQTSVQVKFRHTGLRDKRFSPEMETAAYRIVQEALTNVARHAKSREVAVQVQSTVKALLIEIKDSGEGFDYAKALESRVSSGLSGMRERAGLIGGELSLASAPGKGTRIRASIPHFTSRGK
jgi:PAS domain S-box-containing protein